MNQVLSQSEVDALLAAVSETDAPSSAPTQSSASGGGGNSGGQSNNNGKAQSFGSFSSNNGATKEKVIVVYDLTSQDRIIRGRLPQLDVIYEKFMRAFRISLSSALRKIATLNLASTDFLKFGEFVNTLPMPTCMSVLRFNALRGSVLFVIESKLAYALVDSFFGGADRPYTKIEGKDFTQIELAIVRKIVDLAIDDLEVAWAPIEKIDCSFQRTEVNPQFVGIVPPTDVVIATTFDVELENANGTITLVMPYATIEPIKQKLSSGFQVESDQTDKKLWFETITEQLMNTSVELTVNLGESTINLQDLTELKVGDVIPLNQDASGEFDVNVENVPKYRGIYGVHHGAVAIQVSRIISDRRGEFING
jgi:flagellar motor switch protein FliM